jgi:hypothetical protein
MPKEKAPSPAMDCPQLTDVAVLRKSPVWSKYKGSASSTGLQKKCRWHFCRKAGKSLSARSRKYKPGSKPVTRWTNKSKCTQETVSPQSNGAQAPRTRVLSSMVQNWLLVMLVTPSKATALLLWRMIFTASIPDWVFAA